MQSAPKTDFTIDTQESFKVGYTYLKSRVEYILNSPRVKPDTWCVVCWSVKVQRSSITKSGTKADKYKLPEAKGCNKTRKQCKRINTEGREVKQRRIRNNP